MKICLIGVTHPSYNPRLLREADSLTEAGHEVTVITPSYLPDLASRDAELMRTRNWNLRQFDFQGTGISGRLKSLYIRGRRRFYSMIEGYARNKDMTLRSYLYALQELKKMASSDRHDFYIAHAHGALPAAHHASRKYGAALGFDCEDLLAVNDTDPPHVIKIIESEYLNDCDYVSVPSEHIGSELRKDYDIKSVTVLYNTFPLRLRKNMPEPAERQKGNALKLHWFGKTIGPGRGLEDAVIAAGMLSGKIVLHLRGNLDASYRSHLNRLAERHEAVLQIHPQVHHEDLISSMSGFDVGLALETPLVKNLRLTVTNKLFSYLLAGLPVVATDTAGQLEVMERAPEAGRVYRSGDTESLAAILDEWYADRESLAKSSQYAWDAASGKYCWDVEKHKFLEEIEKH